VRPALAIPVALVVAVCAISSGGVLARLAGDADPVVVAFWRTALAALILSPSLRRLQISWRAVGLTALAGLCLAAHFWTWFASLNHISVMRSVVLVTLAPLWVGLMEWGLFKQRPPLRFWLGIGLALVGVVFMATAEQGQASMKGDALALIGGVLSSAYLVIGREVRQTVHWGPYGALVCGSAAVWLLPVALIGGLPLVGWTPGTWAALVGLALVPQLLGHVGFNFAMKWVPARTIAALILLEPVGATLLAAVVLAEVPQGIEVLGGVGILAGVGLATLRRGTETPPSPTPDGSAPSPAADRPPAPGDG
jgi:drug/metabolite transporter (DMT)-like permease